MSTDTDRLRKARKNREIQLQRWTYFEEEHESKCLTAKSSAKPHIEFDNDIVILEAVARNDVSEVTQLLSDGANPNAANTDGLTGLHQCCIDDYREMVELLLRSGADVNSHDTEMWTPLHAAATCGRDAIVALLCKYGADFLALNADGNMPYDICEGERCLSSIEKEMSAQGITQTHIDETRQMPEVFMLKDVREVINSPQKAAVIDALDSQGANMLHIACSMGYLETCQALLEAGARITVPDKDGWLPVHIAACWSQMEILELLVAFGADLDVGNKDGETVYDICEPDLKPRVLQLRQNAEGIRRNFKHRNISQYRSFRKSRGSSVRRTSVKQKNLLARKEAHNEFIAVGSTPQPPTYIENVPSHKPAPIEEAPASVTVDSGTENSDVDETDRGELHTSFSRADIDGRPIKSANQSAGFKPSSNSRTPKTVSTNQGAITVPPRHKSRPANPDPVATETTQPSIPKNSDPGKESAPTPPTNNGNHSNSTPLPSNHINRNSSIADPLNRSVPYVFSSPVENYKITDVPSKPRHSRNKRGCCTLL